MFERFTDRAQRVVVLSQEEARSLNHFHIGTEHLLLGLLHEGEGVGPKVLESLGVSLEAVRERVEGIVGQGQEMLSGHIPFTAGAKKVLEYSLREALGLNHNYIGTEHLLLGMLREGEGVAAQVLAEFGLDLDRTHRQVVQLLDFYTRDEPAAAPQREAEPDRWDPFSDPELRVAIQGLPLLGADGVTMPLALLLDLIRLTGRAQPRDPRLNRLAAHAGVERLRALGWEPQSRVGFAGLLAADLPDDGALSIPDAPAAELRDALREVVGDLASARPEINELKAQLETLNASTQRSIESRDFERAAELRVREQALRARLAELVRQQNAANWALPDHLRIDGIDDEAVAALEDAAESVTDQTALMLRILGPASVATKPTLPLQTRHRIAALPHVAAPHRDLIAEGATFVESRDRMQSPSSGGAGGVAGISRHGRLINLLQSQLALPPDLFMLRMANRDLVYRLRQTEAESPPPTVTLVLDTGPATFGPAEATLRLLAHMLVTTLWSAGRFPALVTTDQPRLVRHITGHEDLVTVWTSRGLEPPAMEAALATAGSLGDPVVVLTEYHLARELPLVAHAALRLLTTHVLDDAPSGPASGPFHIHIGADAEAADLTGAVAALLNPAPNTDDIGAGRPVAALARSDPRARRDTPRMRSRFRGTAYTGLTSTSASAQDSTQPSVAVSGAEITEDSLNGRFLVASPALADPRFERTVGLILDHDADGSLVVVVNRPSPVPVADVLPAWAQLATEPNIVFYGGPVNQDSALGLALTAPGQATPLGAREVVRTICLVDLDQPAHADEFIFVRIFVGYAGWASGVLRSEIENGAWYVIDADPNVLLRLEADQIWEAACAAPHIRLALTTQREPA